MANTLAYYDTATITAVKSFIVQAPGGMGALDAKKDIYKALITLTKRAPRQLA